MEIYSNEFLDFYFYKREPSIFNYKSLYTFYASQNLKINLSALLPETKDKVIRSVNYLLQHEKLPIEVYKNTQYFLAAALSEYPEFNFTEKQLRRK